MEPRFGRVLTAMISPFTADGSLDIDGAVTLARWLEEQGNDGLVLAGTTGESPTLTQDEQVDMIAAVVEAVQVPVIAGAGSNDTRSAVRNAERCAEVGVAGILDVTPYYNRPSQAGLVEHFRTTAAATDLPVMLYDIPPRSGRKIDTDTILRLADEVDNIVAVKDAAGDVAGTARLIAAAPEGFEVYSGEDCLTLSLLAVGAVGTVSVASHWCTPETVAMMTAFFSGDAAEAAEINRRLIPSYDFESGDLRPNPVPTKAMMKVLGLPGGDCRLPMGPEPEGLQDEARRVLVGLGRG
ncbi:MAG: 4-hydroxy-tetrahydrodipicolinate synthase [Acidimicrobiaceae bacterium]|jgi:4-hydroxy-tetrahydrodipicolinate synthase|nr:4-hydroxy-tetrahydrodipicolinate synthase [Acidimicrobiaceae bacterium]MDP6481782.1 4-hydroxy-tetrahydrodipicolinate synthase [Acidimicrobiales bacterium]MDP6696432.1 4-hydroxy-tetrahydrodipicolinate synthase [Acidimicrobiales bacterium]|tara:strand:+ start:774 stop:1661 length:888 start_codon:yes stop_codon:yes gene_type:complete